MSASTKYIGRICNDCDYRWNGAMDEACPECGWTSGITRGHTNGQGSHEKLVFDKVSQLDLRPQPQLIRGWFPRSEVCIVAGKPSSGKGIVLADIMARGSRWDEMPNGDRLTSRFMSGVICLPGEDSKNEWGRRLTVADVDPDMVLTIEVNTIDRVVLAVDGLAENGAELIIIDSLGGLAGSSGLDTNKGEVRVVLDDLSQTARRHNITIVIIHHTRKAYGDPLDVLQGNTQIGAATRSVLIVVEERVEEGAEPDVRLFGVAKLNGSKRSDPVGFRTVGRAMFHPDGQPMRDDRGDTAYIPRVEWVTDRKFTQGAFIAACNGNVLQGGNRDQDAESILAGGPMTSTDFNEAMTQSGYGASQIKTAKKAVAVVIKSSTGEWWTCPKQPRDLAKKAVEDLVAGAA